MSNYEANQEESGGRGASGGRFGGRRAKICQFCADKVVRVEYKDADLLRRFLTDNGKIRPRRQTGTCAKHQRSLATAIKRSRHLAMIPYTGDRSRAE
jgi:small subunit ribosomal protein S18